VPKSWEKTFFNWMENIQPWCVSRQLWWGHRIPAWYGPIKNDSGAITYDPTRQRSVAFVAESLDEAVGLAAAHSGPEWKIANFYGRTFHVNMVTSISHIWRQKAKRRNCTSARIVAISTSSTPGSPPRCGRSGRLAGPKRLTPLAKGTTPATCSFPASTSCFSGMRDGDAGAFTS